PQREIMERKRICGKGTLYFSKERYISWHTVPTSCSHALANHCSTVRFFNSCLSSLTVKNKNNPSVSTVFFSPRATLRRRSRPKKRKDSPFTYSRSCEAYFFISAYRSSAAKIYAFFSVKTFSTSESCVCGLEDTYTVISGRIRILMFFTDFSSC